VENHPSFPVFRSPILLDFTFKGIGIIVELLQIPVGVAEVMGQLVDDRLADFDHQLLATSEVFFERTLEDKNLVRQIMDVNDIAAPGGADIERNKEAVQAFPGADFLLRETGFAKGLLVGLLLNIDDDVLQVRLPSLGQRLHDLGNDLTELLKRYSSHEIMLPGFSGIVNGAPCDQNDNRS